MMGRGLFKEVRIARLTTRYLETDETKDVKFR